MADFLFAATNSKNQMQHEGAPLATA